MGESAGVGTYRVEVSTIDLDPHPQGMLVKRDYNYGYHHGQGLANRLPFLANEGEILWIDSGVTASTNDQIREAVKESHVQKEDMSPLQLKVIDRNGIGSFQCYNVRKDFEVDPNLYYTAVSYAFTKMKNGNLQLTFLLKEDQVIHENMSSFQLSNTRNIKIKSDNDTGDIVGIRFTEIFSSRDDETQQIKLVWNMRLEKMENTGAPVFKVKQDPNMQMIELSEGPAVDKTGEKVQRCTKCRRPKKGHALPVGKNCKYASN